MEDIRAEERVQRDALFDEIIKSSRFERIFACFEGLLGKQMWTFYFPDGRRVLLPLTDAKCECPASPDDWTPDDCRQFAHADINAARTTARYLVAQCPNSGNYRALIPLSYRNCYQGSFAICFRESKDLKAIELCVTLFAEYLSMLSESLADYDDASLVLPLWDQMVSTRSLDDLLRRILTEALNSLGLSVGAMLLVDDDLHITPLQTQGISEDLLLHHPLTLRIRDYEDTIQNWKGVVVELPKHDPISEWLIQISAQSQSSNLKKVLAIPILRSQSLLALIVAPSDLSVKEIPLKFRAIQLLMEGSAAAISNAIIFEKMNQKALALTCIHAMHRLMNYPITEQDLLSRIGRVILQALQVTKCSIMLINKERTLLEPKVWINLEKNEVGTEPLRSGESIPGWVWENYAPLIVNSWKEDHRFQNDPAEKYPGHRYLSMPMIESDVLGVITVSGKDRDFTPGDREVFQYVTEQAVIALNNARLCESQQHLTLNTLKSIANVVEMKDPYKVGHTEKMAESAEQIAARMGLDYESRMNLKYAALLHDAGGIGVRDRETGETGSTDFVRDMEGHLDMSVQIARSLGLSESIIKMIRHHHENFDGSGYPSGLRGQAIPLGSRIIAVADIFVALTAGRGNHRTLSPQEAINFLRNLAGKRFDPEIVSLLARIVLHPK